MMPRRLRFIPEGGALVEVTCRTIHGRMLLKPTKRLNEAIVGALARAKRRYGVRICAVVYMANHCHLLLHVDDAHQLSRFMAYVNAKIAREAGRIWRWKEKIWGRRYQGIVISDEEAAQVARLRYLLSHGPKENLVERCRQWLGVHSAEALATGRTLAGFWFDRTKAYAALKRGRSVGAYDYAEREVLELDPLPCWSNLDDGAYRARMTEIVEDVENEARARRQHRGINPLGESAIRRQRAHDRPKRFERSPAPVFHAATKEARQLLIDAYRWFAAVYREAADRLLAGDGSPGFPVGSFPPALPFVHSGEAVPA